MKISLFFSIAMVLLFTRLPLCANTLPDINAEYHNAWTKQYGSSSPDFGRAVTTDSSGNIYITGVTYGDLDGNTNSGSYDIFLTKFSSDGTRVWTKQYGTGSSDHGRSMTIDSSGNLYITGYTYGDLDGNTNSGVSDIFLSKFSSDGTKLWTKQYGSGGAEYGESVTTDSSGNLYITGYTWGNLDGNTNSGEGDIYLTKFSSDGTRLWTKQYGSSGHDQAWSVTSDSSGNLYITGVTYGDLDGNSNSGGNDIFLCKFSSDGTKLWTQQYGSSNEDDGLSVTAYSNGSIYITGITYGDLDGNTNSGVSDIFLSKFSSDGIRLWTKQYGSGNADVGESVTIDNSGNLYISGRTYGDFDCNINSGGMGVFLTKFTRTQTLDHAEGTEAVIDINATDADSDTLTYSIGGADSDDFVIDSASGLLSFLPAPYADMAMDENSDNIYEVDINVSDGNGGSDGVPYVITVRASRMAMDFNKDGIGDLIIRNTTTGATYSWLMNSSGGRSAAAQIATILLSDWNIEGTGDYNGDGVTDIVVRHKTTGATYTWLMDSDGTRQSYKLLATIPESDWEIAGTESDFNKDGVNDIVVRNKTNGQTFAWLMKRDGTRESYALLAVIPADQWQIAGTNSDFNNDGISDIIVRNNTEGWTYVWLMNACGKRTSYKHITNLPAAQWEIAGTESDFNRDGVSDVVVRNKTHGYTYIWIMDSDGSRASYKHITNLPFSDWEIAGTKSDFNGDGTSDMVVRKKTTGTVFTWLMNTDGTRESYNVITNIPVSDWEIIGTDYDFNKDGSSDLVVRNTTTGATYSWLMNVAGTRDSSVLIDTIAGSAWKMEAAK